MNTLGRVGLAIMLVIIWLFAADIMEISTLSDVAALLLGVGIGTGIGFILFGGTPYE